MKQGFLISCIRNVQEDYAKIFRFITERSKESLEEVQENTFCCNKRIMYKMSMGLLQKIETNIEASCIGNRILSNVGINNEYGIRKISDMQENVINKIFQEDVVDYMIYVICNDYDNQEETIKSDDVVNLQYFSLMNQILKNMKSNIRVTLFLKPNLKMCVENKDAYNGIYYKASQFLSLDTMKNKQSHFAYRYQDGRFIFDEMSISQKGIWKKFSPLMEISSYQDVELWSKPLLELEKVPLFVKLINNSNESLLKSIDNYDDNKYSWRDDFNEGKYYKIIQLCKEYFCTIPSVSGRRKRKGMPTKKEMSDKLIDLFNSRHQFFDKVKGMSILAFYIMCIFEYFKRTNPYKDYAVINSDDIYEQMFIANDIADGLLQLMENVTSHSEYKQGFFTLRIHTNNKQNTNVYLEEKYKNYFTAEREKKTYYLEVQIVDYSNFGILDTFLRGLKEKKDTDNRQDRTEIYEELINKVSDFTLSSLFFPTDDERKIHAKYNEIDKNNLIHHYGIQLFVSLVDSCDGCFWVKSMGWRGKQEKNTYSNVGLENNASKCLPGTQYSILLPFEYQKNQIDTSLNANIDYVEYLEKEFKVVDISFKYNKENFAKYYNMVEKRGRGHSWQKKKEDTINLMAQEVLTDYEQKKEKGKTNIFNFDAEKIDLGCIEYFCKICIYIVAQTDSKEGVPIAIRNCKENHFLSIVRMFAVFYDKQGESQMMSRMQIYLVGEDSGEEFIITGKNIKTAINAAEKLAFTRGINGRYIDILAKMLERRQGRLEVENVKFIPFDLEIKYDDGKTPFQRGITCVLERDIREEQFGCKIENAHMRLGSKIHIKDFYEAELLFHNNYYTSRFAYQILKEINKHDINYNKKIMIVGYETYSEMLLYEIVNLMKKRCSESEINYKEIDYMYYENKSNIFRMFNGKERKEISVETQYVVIVPINSTLTTHDKLIALIKEKILEGKEPDIIEKIAIVLIRDSGEKNKKGISEREEEFWEENSIIENELATITTKELSGQNKYTIKYLISLETEWHNPLKCKYCLPDKKNNLYYTEELPLIETNKASVVPMQKIRKKAIAKAKSLIDDEKEEENNSRIKKLGDYLIYKHIVRNNNHYNYYFETEKYIKGEKDKIGDWLKKECAPRINEKSDRLVFDILVAPLHYSNTAFVEEVNMRVFHGASLVLHFDVEKEFRENISTKFSNIKILYDNLQKSKKKAVIRFHYVDDTIVSGNTFYRMRSVIKSIFPRKMYDGSKKDENIDIEIFSTIFLLLNRCSQITKFNYIKDIKNYFAYVDLYISSMRNHEDACVLCKYISECKRLENSSATNSLIQYWGNQQEKHKIYHLSDDREKNGNENSEDNKERNKRRLYCSHKATLILRQVEQQNGNEQNEIKSIRGIIVDKMFFDPQENCGDFETILSYIKVISRPFIVYSRTVKIAIFSLIIEMLDYILFGEESIQKGNKICEEHYNLYRWLGKYCIDNENISEKDSKDAYYLLITLMKRSSGLGSTYIIRKRNIDKIFSYYSILLTKSELISKKESKENFQKRYLAMVKRNIGLSNDEIKCVYLEYLILFGKEYDDKVGDENANLLKNEENIIYSYLFLENNRVLIDAVSDLRKDMKGMEIESDLLIDVLNNKYYYMNFRRLLFYYGMVILKDDKEYKIKEFKDDITVNSVKSFIILSSVVIDINNNSSDIAKRYKAIRQLIKSITMAKEANIFVTYTRIEQAQDGFDKIKGYKLGEDDTDRFHSKSEIMLPNSSINMNTYYIEKLSGNTHRIIICDMDKSGKEYNISFELLFENKEEKDIYIGIKMFMAFWSEMLKYMEGDLKNNLIEKWKEAQEFKYQITKSRAKDHTDDDDLQQALINLRERYNGSKPESTEASEMLQLIINMYIARFNSRSLAGIDKEIQRLKGKCKFEVVYNVYLRSMISILETRPYNQFIIKYDGSDEITSDILNSTIRYITVDDRGDTKYPPHHHIAIIIAESILSAAKNGKKNINNEVVININKDGQYLVIKNEIKDTEQVDKVRNKINKAIDRENDGISLATIFSYFKDFYGDEDKGIIDINEDTKEFIIKLRIFRK
ncbi:MAG: hypothetical protein ACLRZ9_12560 [Eubacterium sp.]